MKRNFFMSAIAVLMVSGIAFFSACGDDDVAKPVVSLTSTSFTGKVGAVATTTATATAAGGFKQMKITKYIGTTIDNTYGTNGTLTVTTPTHALSYTLNEEGLSAPVRFNFVAEDNDGQTTSVDFVITTEVSLRYVLTKYNWRWDSKFGKELAAEPAAEKIRDCEKDNFYILNADGSMSINFGTLTGAGGGTCDFDAFVSGVSWSLNDATQELTLTFAGGPEVYKVTSFSATEIKSTSYIDLTVFGAEYAAGDWNFTWKAQAK